MSDWLTPEERKTWAALTVRSNEPGAMALLDKVDALVRKLQERTAHISNQEATELQDILRTLVPSGVALITNARELRDEWDKEKKRAENLGKKLAAAEKVLEAVRLGIRIIPGKRVYFHEHTLQGVWDAMVAYDAPKGKS